ncbi:NAD(P)-binding domain-containing protein [Corynebacterium pacaense]|uniref:NAD(P)-binding domain-containing protein n=1 Tax=Corynebacterium pacaense TaxID=1816684 RepID=UPI0009BAB003|nr:NAD(P)/FAD-dependent oxidoreductase [Corynebacterium pacaense]
MTFRTQEPPTTGTFSIQVTPTPEDGALKELEEQVRAERELIGHRHDWVPDPPNGAYNVIVIGGGQAGLGTAFALQRQRIGRVKVLEAGPEEEVGCWARYARMHTLRSPKHLKGIELDVPSLHVRRWVEARYGNRAWEDITLVPRLDWNDYLAWYRKVTDADVSFRTRVTEVLPPDADGNFTVRTEIDGADGELYREDFRARRIVFALGLDGGGGPQVPEMIRGLPGHLWAHTEDAIDFEALRGRRVAVIGGGASGFDNASTALEAGAATVEVHMRRGEVPSNNPLRWMEFPGMQEHFFDLSDAEKWEFTCFNGGLPQPPTQASIWRAFDYPGFSLKMNSQWAGVRTRMGDQGEEIVIVDEQGGEHVADFIISATGYVVDLSLRPELRHFLPDIKLWSDAFEPAEHHPLGAYPHLGDGFQFEPVAGAPGYVSRLFHLSTGARLSHGVAGNQLSGIFAGLNRLSGRVATDITRENWASFMSDFREFEFREITEVGPHSGGSQQFAREPRYLGR